MVTMNEQKDEEDFLGEAYSTVNALAHPIRWEMMLLIQQRGQVPVQELGPLFGLEKAHLSQHLKVLRDVQLVHTLRSSKFVYYSINRAKFERAIKLIRKVHPS